MPVFRDVDFEHPDRQFRSGVFASEGAPGTTPALDCSKLPTPSSSFCCNACSQVRPGGGAFIGWDEKCRAVCDCDLPCPKAKDAPKTILGFVD
jgi:hypothetical protein